MHPDNFRRHSPPDCAPWSIRIPSRRWMSLNRLSDARLSASLAEILRAVYVEISETTGIDWHFTALQWKLGNADAEQFLGISRQASVHGLVSSRFSERVTLVPKCDTPHALPFSFKPEWTPCDAKVGAHHLNSIKLLFQRILVERKKPERNGGRYRI